MPSLPPGSLLLSLSLARARDEQEGGDAQEGKAVKRARKSSSAAAKPAVLADLMARLPKGVGIVWKKKTVNGKQVVHHTYGIASYRATCNRPNCKRANPKGVGFSGNFETIESAAQAFKEHCCNPFNLDRDDLMHWE